MPSVLQTLRGGNTYAYEILDWSGSPARAGVVFVATMAVIMPLYLDCFLSRTGERSRVDPGKTLEPTPTIRQH